MAYEITNATDEEVSAPDTMAVRHMRTVAVAEPDLASLRDAVSYLISEVGQTGGDPSVTMAAVGVQDDGTVTISIDWTPVRTG